jgi:cation:H+ antiporter
MIVASLWIILGFALLIFGADALVKGASVLAKRLKMSDLAIGLTIVAFGTSAPELVVSLAASVN